MCICVRTEMRGVVTGRQVPDGGRRGEYQHASCGPARQDEAALTAGHTDWREHPW